jgi:hypothetical protein
MEADWTIRVWYQWSVLPESAADFSHMWNLKEFNKGEELKVCEWILDNKNNLGAYHITDGSKTIKVSLQAR